MTDIFSKRYRKLPLTERRLQVYFFFSEYLLPPHNYVPLENHREGGCKQYLVTDLHLSFNASGK